MSKNTPDFYLVDLEPVCQKCGKKAFDINPDYSCVCLHPELTYEEIKTIIEL